MKKILLNNKGVSLAEIMVGVGIFGVVSYIFMGSSSFMSSLNSDVKNKLNVERTVVGLFEKIQSNSSRYQITSDPSDFLSVTNKDELMKTLPLAWNDRVLVDVEECSQCKGRLGFIVTPHPDYRGLYKLHIRTTHLTLIDNFKDYSFLINGQ